MRNVTAESMAILKNTAAIAVSQDPLGQMGIRLTGDIPEQIWARELANGCAARRPARPQRCSHLASDHAARSDVAVGLYNKGTLPPDASAQEVSDAPGADITISFSMVNLHGSVTVYDIWEQKSAGAFTGSYTVRAPATLAS